MSGNQPPKPIQEFTPGVPWMSANTPANPSQTQHSPASGAEQSGQYSGAGSSQAFTNPLQRPSVAQSFPYPYQPSSNPSSVRPYQSIGMPHQSYRNPSQASRSAQPVVPPHQSTGEIIATFGRLPPAPRGGQRSGYSTQSASSGQPAVPPQQRTGMPQQQLDPYLLSLIAQRVVPQHQYTSSSQTSGSQPTAPSGGHSSRYSTQGSSSAQPFMPPHQSTGEIIATFGRLPPAPRGGQRSGYSAQSASSGQPVVPPHQSTGMPQQQLDPYLLSLIAQRVVPSGNLPPAPSRGQRVRSAQTNTRDKPPIVYLNELGLRRLAIQAVLRYEQVGKSGMATLLSIRDRMGLNDDHNNMARRAVPNGGGAQMAPIGAAHLDVQIPLSGGGWHTVMNQFYCRISGLFYLGAYTRREADGSEVKDELLQLQPCADYWEFDARQQYGWHAFAIRTGEVCTNSLRLSGSDGKWDKRAPISTLYPTVRLESVHGWKGTFGANWEHWKDGNQVWFGFHWLTLGLAFDGPPTTNHYNRGDRYHVRYGSYGGACVWGHVYELTDNTMEDRLNHLARPLTSVPPNDGRDLMDMVGVEVSRPRPAQLQSVPNLLGEDKATQTDGESPAERNTCWAVYVCAGAKLLVMDAYNHHRQKYDHNRALVQQGGVVAGRGQLVFSAPVDGNANFVLSDIQQTTRTPGAYWGSAASGTGSVQHKHAFDVSRLSAERRKELAAIKNPVVFLGPLESEYGSIAWCLDIQRSKNTDARSCVLGIPEGAWFAAIEDWDVGLRELKARHLYERLHESNVEMANMCHIPNDRRFEVPADRELAKRIVGVDAEARQVSTDIHVTDNRFNSGRATDAPERTPLPLLYRSRRVIDWERGYDKGLRPPMPPDWPLVEYSDQNKTYRKHNGYGFMANGFVKTKDTAGVNIPVHNLYKLTAGATQAANDTYAVYQKEGADTRDIYYYKKVNTPGAPYDGVDQYMGIDGWVYQKQNSTSVGQCKMDWYKHVGTQP